MFHSLLFSRRWCRIHVNFATLKFYDPTVVGNPQLQLKHRPHFKMFLSEDDYSYRYNAKLYFCIYNNYIIIKKITS